MEKILFSFILAVSISLPAYAQDLLSIYKLALQNDSQFRAAQAEYHALLELKEQSNSQLYPTISINGNYTEYNSKATASSSASKYNTQGYNLNLVQPIYNHANIVGLYKADAQVAQAAVTFKNEQQDLILRVATRYFDVLAANDDLAFAKAERTAIHEQLIQTQQRFNVGLISITDVHEAQARYDQAVAQTIVAENAVAISYETLREITASEHKGLARLSTKHPLVKPVPANIKQWVNTALLQNSLLKASEKNVDIAREEVNLQRASHYPTLDLSAQHSRTDYGENDFFSQRQRNDTTLSLQLNIPLYQGGLVNSRTRTAAHRLIQARENLEQQRRATERETRNSYLKVIANISQVKALKQALASSSVALEATQAGFEVGTRTAVDVLNSQRELYRARRDYAQVRYNYVLETLRLKFAAGTLSNTDIEQLNPWLK